METIDWKNLGFGYSKADFIIRCWYRNGQWGELEVSDSENVTLHIAATTFHYGQEAFEGLKAFRGKDGKIRVFRMEENAKRMQRSSQGIMMAEVPTALFTEAVRKAVKLNEGFVPPFESGAALYIRPLLIGTGPQIGVKPADEYLFMVMVMPVGPYLKKALNPPIWLYTVNTIVRRHLEPELLKWAAIMQPALLQGNGLTKMDSPLFCILMQKKRNTSTSVVLPIFSV